MLALSSLVACETAGFQDAYTALDGTGKRRRDVFFTDTENIFCVAEVASGVDDVTVSADFYAVELYDPSTGDSRRVNEHLASQEANPGKGKKIVLPFSLVKDPDVPWAVGRFVCRLGLNGVVERELGYEVRFPDCPDAPIRTGAVCAGFVDPDAECPGAAGDTCRCNADGAWLCQ
jgi:hypothetical protein